MSLKHEKYAKCASFIKDKIHSHLDPVSDAWKSQPTLPSKVMSVATSKIGMIVIAGVMVIGTLISLIPHHDSSGDISHAAASSWRSSNSETSSNFIKIAKPVMPSLQNQIDLLKTNMADMQKEISALSRSLAQQKAVITAKPPYQLLGIRFDNESQQWIADVQIDNKVKSVMAGEEFDGWHVENVDAQGASIE